jgi:hypothetical protein
MLRRPHPRFPAATLLALLLFAALPAAAQDTVYFDEVPDLPVMPGLEEAAAAGIAFDKPGGRIVTLYAVGGPAPEAVASFYAESLPALGWQAVGEARWTRNAEALRLELERLDGRTVARFTLAPE